jgi:hypothetical protein
MNRKLAALALIALAVALGVFALLMRGKEPQGRSITVFCASRSLATQIPLAPATPMKTRAHTAIVRRMCQSAAGIDIVKKRRKPRSDRDRVP